MRVDVDYNKLNQQISPFFGSTRLHTMFGGALKVLTVIAFFCKTEFFSVCAL
jgi:hypothetical protein